ncbi:MAG: hypothetical protein ACI8UX_001971 [Psychromonas sp.]|jgi:hypothetical protein
MKYLIVFFLMLLVGGCRSNYALLQGSSLGHVKIKKRDVPKIALLKPKEISLKLILPDNNHKIERTPRVFPELKAEESQVVISKFVGTVIDKELVGPEPKNKEKQKKKRKRDRFWRQMGSNLLIGIVFLSVAVLMALIQVPSLTLLFGLASILFLIFGLKKVFRKRKRKSRNPFNKEK